MKLTNRLIETISRDAGRACIEIAFNACMNADEPEQQYIILTHIAAHLFGACGAAYERANPGTAKVEAAKATVEHISRILIKTYSQ